MGTAFFILPKTGLPPIEWTGHAQLEIPTIREKYELRKRRREEKTRADRAIESG